MVRLEVRDLAVSGAPALESEGRYPSARRRPASAVRRARESNCRGLSAGPFGIFGQSPLAASWR